MVTTLLAIPSCFVATRRRYIPQVNELISALIWQMCKNIYHMCNREEWERAAASGSYSGSAQDRADGFIHFSTAEQLPDSARKHRAGQPGLVLLAVDPAVLGSALKWEPSRNGALFPHLYGALPISAVSWVRDLPLGADGVPVLPPLA
jgi:uncharacterized protein (DUF952 family)